MLLSWIGEQLEYAKLEALTFSVFLLRHATICLPA